jgi:hypothetical protein
MRARLLLCLALAGCADSGSISFTLELPADPTLDPFALQVSDLTLVATSGGEPLYSATRPFRGPGESLDFGAVPVGDDVSFALIAAAPSGRVLGYGRTDAPVDLAADRGYDIALRVRRPFAYVAGGEALLAVDATSEPGQRYATAIDVGGSPRSAAVTPDGADVVVAVDGAVRLVSTSTHLMRDASVSLPGPVGDLALSPDGAWAVVSHPESPTGVSIVELAALRAGAPAEPVFVVTGAPGQLAVSNDTAWVMLDPLDNIFAWARRRRPRSRSPIRRPARESRSRSAAPPEMSRSSPRPALRSSPCRATTRSSPSRARARSPRPSSPSTARRR